MGNEKFISIPPYISTSWKNIRALRMEDTHLIITLTDGSVVRVPNLNQEDVKEQNSKWWERISETYPVENYVI